MKRAASFGFCLILFCYPAHSQQRRSTRNTFRDFVTALPDVDRVDVLEVSALQTDDLKNVDCTKSDLVCAPGRFPLKIDAVRTISGEAAKKLSAQWRKLTIGTGERCFSPSHVLRFYKSDSLMLTTEVGFFPPSISLPNEHLAIISGNMVALYSFRSLLMPDSMLKARSESFKREMMPQVGHQITIIGSLGTGKLGWLVSFAEWGVYIRAMRSSDIPKDNALNPLSCHTIKVTGTLRYFSDPPPSPKPDPPAGSERQIVEGRAPEHFYFDVAEAKVTEVSPPPNEHTQKRSGKKYRR